MTKGYRVLSHGSKATKGNPFNSPSFQRSERTLQRYLRKYNKKNASNLNRQDGIRPNGS